MRKLPKPCDKNGAAFAPKDVFDLCISNVRNADLKARLHDERDAIARAAVDYDKAAAAARLHKIERHTDIGDVTKDEMIDVYTKRMVPKSQPGRPVYDRIISAPKHQRCPLCDVGAVNTLDHHLPKTEYAILSVTPNNLIPSCMWCQRAKKTGYPTSAGEQTIHPYFDDFESAAWLQAEVVESTPAAFRFFIQAPADWDDTNVQRLKSHLVTFELPLLYSENAGSELSGIRHRLNRIFNAGGSDAVQKHLQEEAVSWEQESRNSWKAAMFRAAAASDWFCEGGFSDEDKQ